MWLLEALAIRSKCFPYLFSFFESNTRNRSASRPKGRFGWGSDHNNNNSHHQHQNNTPPNTPIGQRERERETRNMGKEEKKAQPTSTSPKNVNQAGKAEREQSGEPAQEPEAAMQKKKAQRDPKAGQEEDVHTCWGCRFPLLVAFCQLVLGASVIVLGFLMAGISSSLLVRDTPYWAGIIVCVVASLGLVMLCVSYQPDEKTCIQFAIKVTYFLLSALCLIVCVLVVAFAAYRYSQITHFTCEMIPETCQCKLDIVDPLSRTFLFQNVLDCTDITGTFSLYLLIQIVLNLLAGIVCFVACFVMWKDRYQVFYVGTWLHSITSTGVQQQKV